MGKGCKSECGSYSSIAVIDTLSEAWCVSSRERVYANSETKNAGGAGGVPGGEVVGMIVVFRILRGCSGECEDEGIGVLN
jgi:hypothetical protein